MAVGKHVVIQMTSRHTADHELDKSLRTKLVKMAKTTNQRNSTTSRIFLSLKTFILVVNVVIILTCTATLIFQGSKCLMRYFSSDTKAILSVKKTGEATFLAFTICPRFEEAYDNVTLGNIGIDKSMYKDGYFYGAGPSKDTDRGGFEIFRDVSYELAEIMDTVTINTADRANSRVVVNFSTPLDEDVALWSTVLVDTFGRCYQMQISRDVTALGIISVVMVARMGIYVYLHHPGQFMDIDSKTKVYGHLGEMLFIDLTHELTVNTLEQDGEIPCNASMDWKYDDCVSSAIRHQLIDDYGCVVPFVPEEGDEPAKICSFDESAEDGLQFKADVMESYEFLSSNGQRTLCPVPCATIEVFLGLPFFGIYSSDRAFIKMYIKSTVKMKKTVLDYTWVSMLAEIGGYTGLLLGISVVNITNYIDRIIFRFIRG